MTEILEPERVRLSPKFRAIIEGAGWVFGQYGFARTQMADIAAEAGVALGTLYRYAPSKDVLFYLVLLSGAGASDAEIEAAVSCEDVDGVLRDFVVGLRTSDIIEDALNAAMGSQTPIEDFVGSLYDATEKIHVAVRVLDRSGREWPNVRQLFDDEIRAPIVQLTEKFLTDPAFESTVRRVPDPAVTARLVLELTAWMAMHRRYSRHTENISDTEARIATIDFAVAALSSRT